MKLKTAFGALAVLFCVAAAPGAFATAIPTGDGGILNIAGGAGSFILGVTTFPVPCYSFAGGTLCAGASHLIEELGPSADFLSGGMASIKDFSIPSVTVFETVQGGPAVGSIPVNFDLEGFLPGAGTATACTSNTVNNVCTPAGLPFTITQTGSTSVSISFDVSLDAYTGSLGSGFTAYEGIFTSQIAGTLSGVGACAGLAANITNIVSCEGAGGTLLTTWTATELPVPPSATPEPTSLLLLGSGLLGLAGTIRRARRV